MAPQVGILFLSILLCQWCDFHMQPLCYRELLTSAPHLVVGTSTGLLQVNAFTMELCQYWSLQGE